MCKLVSVYYISLWESVERFIYAFSCYNIRETIYTLLYTRPFMKGYNGVCY